MCMPTAFLGPRVSNVPSVSTTTRELMISWRQEIIYQWQNVLLPNLSQNPTIMFKDIKFNLASPILLCPNFFQNLELKTMGRC